MKWHSEELHDFCSSPSINRAIKFRRIGWVGHVGRIGERKGAYRVLVDKSDVRRAVGKPRLRCEDNIKTNLQEIGWESLD